MVKGRKNDEEAIHNKKKPPDLRPPQKRLFIQWLLFIKINVYASSLSSG
jgi:hypothetical protein